QRPARCLASVMTPRQPAPGAPAAHPGTFMKKLRLTLCLLLLAILAGAVTQALAREPRQTNLLSNPSFEDPYNADGAASGWARWHRDTQTKPENCSAAYAFLPQWSRET